MIQQVAAPLVFRTSNSRFREVLHPTDSALVFSTDGAPQVHYFTFVLVTVQPCQRLMLRVVLGLPLIESNDRYLSLGLLTRATATCVRFVMRAATCAIKRPINCPLSACH